MHELSLAIDIVDLVKDHVKNNNATKVHSVTIEIGTMSGAIPDLLKFAMTEAIHDSILEKAEIIFNIVQARAHCHSCGYEFDINDIYTPCPACQSTDIEIIAGKDMILKSISIE